MKQHILLSLIGLFWINLAFSQPIVLVKGTEDSLAVKKQIIQYLDDLDVKENVHLSVSFTRHVPENVEGMTFCLNSPAPNNHQVIRVRIDAHLNKIQQRLVLAHEMIHVKQFARGELIMINNQQVMWKGQKYWCLGGYSRSVPWESEAHQIDNILVKLDKVQSEVRLVTAIQNR